MAFLMIAFFEIVSSARDIDPVFVTQPVQRFDISDVALGSTQTVLVAGGFAYLCGDAGLQIVDVSDPGAPTVISRYAGMEEDQSRRVSAVALSGIYCWVAISDRLDLLDLSDPRRPRRIGVAAYTSGAVSGLAEAKGYLYALRNDSQLEIFDATDPENLDLAAYSPFIGWKLRIAGNYAYVLTGSGLHVLDITSPRSPRLVGTWDKAVGTARDLALEGGYAYVTTGAWSENDEVVGASLHILDIADPANPRPVGYYEAPASSFAHLAVSERNAFIGLDFAWNEAMPRAPAIHVIDISDPARPTRVGLYQNGLSPAALAAFGGKCYSASGRFGWDHYPEGGAFEVLDVSTPSDPKRVGKLIDEVNWAQDLAAAPGDPAHLFAVDALAGLRVLDISSPENPAEIARIDTGLNSRRAALSGTLACVAVSGWLDGTTNVGSGLRIVDIADPAHPRISGYLPTAEPITDLALDGAFCFVVDDTSGLRVIDLSAPSAPRVASTPKIPAQAVTIGGRYLFAAGSEFQVLDLLEPVQPVPVGRLAGFQRPTAVAVSGGTAVVVDRDAGVSVIDVSDPANPRRRGQQRLTAGINAKILGELACVPTEYGFLEIISIADPANPRRVGGLANPGYPIAAAGSHDYLYTHSGRKGGLNVIKLSRPANPQRVGGNDSILSASDIKIAGQNAFLASFSEGLQLVALGNNERPERIATWNGGGVAWGLDVAGNYAYIAAGTAGLQVVDISKPANPQPAANLSIDGEARAVSIDHNYGYVLANGMQIIDIHDPRNPRHAGAVVVNTLIHHAAIAGPQAYLATTQGLRIYEIAVPASPHEIGRYVTFAHSSDVALQGSYAYLVSGRSGEPGTFDAIDVSNPRQPIRVGQCALRGNPRSIAVLGNYSYIVGGESGLEIIDHSDPARPARVGGNSTFFSANSVALGNGKIYVAAENYLARGEGLTVLETLPFFKAPAVIAGQFKLDWEGWARARLEMSTDLRDPIWREVQLPSTNSLTLPAKLPNAFFRLQNL